MRRLRKKAVQPNPPTTIPGRTGHHENRGTPGAGAIRSVDVAPVVVIVKVEVLPGATEEGLKLHCAPCGAPEQANETMLVNPF
jgi:hypothetical protein